MDQKVVKPKNKIKTKLKNHYARILAIDPYQI